MYMDGTIWKLSNERKKTIGCLYPIPSIDYFAECKQATIGHDSR